MSKLRLTSDKLIRSALKKQLEKEYREDPNAKIIEELGISHGAARVDIAVVNGVLHGYELKSDLDTLYRLPEQMRIYNSVFDQVTLVVGKSHLHEAIKLIPEWWGLVIAKIVKQNGEVSFYNIREADKNPGQDSISVAALLWRNEALGLLEEKNSANGIRSKPRQIIYERLVEVLDNKTLKEKVRDCLRTRINWRSDLKLQLYGD